MNAKSRTRILLAKPGLDGHDRGVKVIALALRNAGMEVVYTGLYQTIPAIVQSAIQEDVDIIGVSILSGAHVPLTRKLMAALSKAGVNDILVLVGGTIAAEDAQTLLDMGVAGVFPVGTPLSHIVHKVEDLIGGHRGP